MEGSQKIASQTPIDVYSGDEGAHPKPAWTLRSCAKMHDSARAGSLEGTLSLSLSESLVPL